MGRPFISDKLWTTRRGRVRWRLCFCGRWTPNAPVCACVSVSVCVCIVLRQNGRAGCHSTLHRRPIGVSIGRVPFDSTRPAPPFFSLFFVCCVVFHCGSETGGSRLNEQRPIGAAIVKWHFDELSCSSSSSSSPSQQTLTGVTIAFASHSYLIFHQPEAIMPNLRPFSNGFSNWVSLALVIWEFSIKLHWLSVRD